MAQKQRSDKKTTVNRNDHLKYRDLCQILCWPMDKIYSRYSFHFQTLLQTHLWPGSSAPLRWAGLDVARLDLGRRNDRTEGVCHHLFSLICHLPHTAQWSCLLASSTWATASTPVSCCPAVEGNPKGNNEEGVLNESASLMKCVFV